MRVKVDLVCMRVENYLFLVRAWKLTWFLRWSKLTWSQCARSNLTSSQCRDEIILVVWVVEIDWLLVCWQKITTNTSIHQKSSEYTASNRAKRHPDTEPTQMSTSISMESSQKSILKIRHVSTIQETHMTTISRIALSQNTHARKV